MNIGKVLNTKTPGWQLMLIAISCSLLLALGACGQRGPLYLPDKNPATESPTEKPESPDEENDEETSGT
jgi:predicted small lipoprotein YifL